MPIDVALLGCGHPHVADVLGVIASEPDLRLAAIWDEDPSAIPVAAGGATSRAVTAIRRADVAVVCAPTDRRPGLCVEAARAGRPVLVEKPLAPSARESREVAREIARSRTPAQAALFLRELPALERLGALLRERTLGRVAGIAATLAHAGALDGWFRGPSAWMADRRRAGGGAFLDLGLHLVDALAALPGREEPVLAGVALDATTGAGDVGGVALGRWAGAPLTLTASWATRPGGLRLVVTGSRATATLRDGVLELDDGTGTPERWVGAPPEAGAALRAFAARVRTRRLPADGLTPAVRAQEILEAAGRA